MSSIRCAQQAQVLPLIEEEEEEQPYKEVKQMVTKRQVLQMSNYTTHNGYTPGITARHGPT